MRDSRNSFMVKPCDICGDTGFEEQIVTCFECKNAREHVYCMRVLVFSIPQIWICEACRLSRGKVSPESVEQKLRYDALKSNDICTEAMKLISVAQKELKLSPGSDLLSRPGCQKYVTAAKSNRTPSRFKVTPRKFPPQMVNARLGVSAAAHCRPFGQGSEESHSVTQCQVSQTSKELKDKRWDVGKEGPEDSSVSANKVETSNTRVKKEFNFTPLTSVNALPTISSGDILYADVQSKSLDIKQSNLQIMPIYELHNSFSSTSDATWCGSIKVRNLESCSELFYGFQAYLSNKVHYKAFEISKQMPGVLPCSLLPCCNIWLELFQNEPPNIDDIALIFLPGNFPRSIEQYASLLRLMEMQDGVLKSCINGVDLLIFSSERIHANSLGLKLGSFLWGLYSTVKGNMAVPHLFTDDLTSQAQGKSCNIRAKVKQSLSEVKIEPYFHPDVPPGFPRRVADAAAGR